MITSRQVRAARALLNWTQERLAEEALVALTALKRLESERGLGVHEGTSDQVRRALEAAGILFIESGQGRGVMLLHETSGDRKRQDTARRARPSSRSV
ncbi:helix-turn-helix domain-containing protein [Acidomonas methanolica]|uniref:XRE family transcriptional regulator n=1 Tax=Acidomonas methanolica TaxID=437 RepID=UPI002119BB02|nr:XRE family transcriptional regulator [Acidomonas methanolica]MCQ9156805.1 XRE family transcriptional regulator [Acidomonas methanolica]